MTIKEKVRVAWEQDLEVRIKSNHDVGFSGKIKGYTNEGIIIPNGPDSWEILEYDRIAEIQLISKGTWDASEYYTEDKPEADEVRDERLAGIYEKLEHALKYEYPIEVRWRSPAGHGLYRKGEVSELVEWGYGEQHILLNFDKIVSLSFVTEKGFLDNLLERGRA